MGGLSRPGPQTVSAVSPARGDDALVKVLYLLRHAKSSWDDPDLPDRDRPLAPRGKRAVRTVAED